jgi:23S rRNA (pseudouridine1915-N3)-methyltransferase
VKSAGEPPPRTEGEDNGEWIIVDCGQAVVHVMQPAIREYYHLEELWGDKPVRMKIDSQKRRPSAAPAREDGHAQPRRAKPRRRGAARAAAARSRRQGRRPRRSRRRRRPDRRRRGGHASPDLRARGAERPARVDSGRAALAMRIVVVAVGTRQPAWVAAAFADYVKRMPPELRVELKEVKAEPRGSRTAAQAMAAEAARIDAAIARGMRRVLLDEHGERVTSAAFARRVQAWQRDGRDAALVIGGPTGSILP